MANAFDKFSFSPFYVEVESHGCTGPGAGQLGLAVASAFCLHQ